MSSHTIPSGFVKSILQNGVGRYVCQLQRLTLKFCKHHGGSRGLREFIERDLIDFCHHHPNIAVYLYPRRHHPPKLVAEYLNGKMFLIDTNNYKREEIIKWIEHLRIRSGVEIIRLRKPLHTDSPSIQGVWTPFTNKATKLNIAEFPNEELSQAFVYTRTASDKLLELVKELQEKKG